MMFVGDRIREARLKAGLTQEELAERINLSRSAIAKYETGEIEPKIPNLIAIAKELEVSTDYILGLTNRSEENAELIAEKVVDLLEKRLAIKMQIKGDGK